MSDNHYAPARVADNAGRAQVIFARFSRDPYITPGVSNAWSSWADGGTVSGSWWVLGAYAKILGAATANTATHIQTQLATGAAGSEVPFATIGDAFSFLTPASTGTYVGYGRTFLVPPILIPNGTLVRQRSSVNTADTSGRIIWNLFGVPVPFYQRKHPLHRPDMYMRGRTGMAASAAMADWMILPTPTSQTVVTTANGAFGAWATVITAASQTAPLLIVGLKCIEQTIGSLLSNPVLAEIGIGEAASAIGIEEVKFCNSSGFGLPAGYMPLRRPIFIPAGSGLSLRAGSLAAQGVLFQVMTVPLR